MYATNRAKSALNLKQLNEGELDSMVGKLNGKLRLLETKYSNFVNHCADVIRESTDSPTFGTATRSHTNSATPGATKSKSALSKYTEL
jgi:hypothetical protein